MKACAFSKVRELIYYIINYKKETEGFFILSVSEKCRFPTPYYIIFKVIITISMMNSVIFISIVRFI